MDLNTGKYEHQAAFAGRCFISSFAGLSNPCTTSTNPVTDLHFPREGMDAGLCYIFSHLDYDKYANKQVIFNIIII